jgi:hypothetical protein
MSLTSQPEAGDQLAGFAEYLPIAYNISFVGRMPFSLSSVVFASTITRIVCLPVSAEVKRRFA